MSHDESGCNCGQDHDKVLVEAMPEMMVLRVADQMAWNVEPEDKFSRAMDVVAESIADSTLDHAMEFARLKNQPVPEMVRGYGATMLVHGIMMGAALRDYYGDKFGTVEIPSEDEVEEAIKRHRSMKEQEGQIRKVNPEDLPPAIRDQLEKAGIDISQVGFMAMEVPSPKSGRPHDHESASLDETPPPGMYL